jgi:hypothetical protein
MIKKNTKVIFEGEGDKKSEEMIGGIPLSKGEIVTIHEGGADILYDVVNKKVDCYLDSGDQIVNITYTLKRKSI